MTMKGSRGPKPQRPFCGWLVALSKVGDAGVDEAVVRPSVVRAVPPVMARLCRPLSVRTRSPAELAWAVIWGIDEAFDAVWMAVAREAIVVYDLTGIVAVWVAPPPMV